ncbi:hypothetical protein Daus18300_011316 [Diaporthe australafricana]|uniref:Uncharacterized protein n=1 Tax=Diaporthe australafricana TaxID=127596 RepID=A0ABR3W6U5_9PEZI
MSIAILGGIVGSPNQVNAIPVSCPTGDCDFPVPEEDSVSYSSLAICSSCVDISEDIVATQKKSNVDGGPDYWWYNMSKSDSSFLGIRERSDGILAASPYPFLNIQAVEQSDISAANRYSPSTNITFMSFTWAGCSKPTEYSDQIDWLDKMDCSSYSRFPGLQNKVGLVATDCSLDLCVRNYESKVRNGELQETTVSVEKDVVFHDATNATDEIQHVIMKSPCWIDGQRYDMMNLSQVPYSPAAINFTFFDVDNEWRVAPRDCVFRTDQVFTRGIFEYMHDIFHTCCKLDNWGPGSEWIACDEEWWYKPLFNGGNADLESVSAAFENIALAMTARMRTTGMMDLYGNEPGRAVGTVTRSTVCIQVFWPWLTLHMFLVALTGLVFALIVYDSRRHGSSQPIWKHSSLVPFFHGLRDEQRGHGTVGGASAPLELSSMKEAAAGMVVQLQQCSEGYGGYGFVLSGTSEESVPQLPSYEPVSMRQSSDKKSPDVLVTPDLGPCSSASVSDDLDRAH